MIPLQDAPEVFVIIKKAIHFRNGSLVLLGAAIGTPLAEIIKEFTDAMPIKDLLMPFLIAALSFMIYLMAYVLDFWSGIQAAKFEAAGQPGYIKSEKLWSSIYKLVAIIIILMGLSFFALVFALLEVNLIYKFFLYSIATVGIMAFLFDMHSVGENYKRRFRAKPRLFEWLDDMTATVNETIIAKIKSFFK
jgi:hypothetical protein